MNKHLWEIQHPYYCNLSNYYAEPAAVRDEFDTWDEFIQKYSRADFDRHLVFRWDWVIEEKEDYEYLQVKDPDPEIREGILYIFWMGQNNGLYHFSEVAVCAADESAVIEFLKPRWDHLKTLWEGISTLVDKD